MTHALPALTIAPGAPCKICGGTAPFVGVVDFNRSCEGPAANLPVAGIAIPYNRCLSCGFLFTCACDGWEGADFQREIYNDDYAVVDPGYRSARPLLNASNIEGLFGAHRAEMDVLDYGGGNGLLARQLRLRGFRAADTYDPFTPVFAAPPQGRFELVTCFETLEHVPDPLDVIRRISALVKPGGMALFSTVVQPADVSLNWLYVAPRNGHVSIFSKAALARAWGGEGWHLASWGGCYHVAFREIPGFARHLVQPPPAPPKPGNLASGKPAGHARRGAQPAKRR